VFRNQPLDEAINRITTNNFKNIEIAMVPGFCPHFDPINASNEDINNLKQSLHDRSLNVVAITAGPGFINDGDSTLVIEFIERCIDIAQVLRAQSIVMPSGKAASKDTWLAEVNLVVPIIKQLADYAEQRNVTITIEAPHINTLTESISQSIQFFNILNDRRIKCTFDTSHVTRGQKTSLVQAALEYNENNIEIGHVHLRDAINYNIEITPGRGNCDFWEFFQILKDIQYTNHLVFELEYGNLETEQIESELEFADHYIRSLLESPVKPRTERRNKSLLKRKFRVLHESLSHPKDVIKRHPFLLRPAIGTFKMINAVKPTPYYDIGWKKRVPFREKNHFLKRGIGRISGSSFQREIRGDKVYNIGVLGCGWAGKDMHGPGFKRLKNTNVTAVCDIEIERAEDAGKTLECNVYSDLEEMISNENLDIVTNCTSELAHYPTTKLLFESDIHVFCEKILTESYSTSRELVDLAEKRGLKFGVNYNYRFMPGVMKMKEIIESEALGKLEMLNFMVHGFSCHHIIDLCWLYGDGIKSVMASYNNQDEFRPFNNTDWSSFHPNVLYVPSLGSSMIFELTNGAIASVTSSILFDYRRFLFSMDAIFREGTASLSGIHGENVIGNLTTSTKIKNLNLNLYSGIESVGHKLTFYRSIESFFASFCSGEAPETDGSHGADIVRVEEAIGESNTTGKCIII